MEFKKREDLEYFIYGLRSLGSGAQGSCGYSKKTGKVYKIFAEFFDTEFLDDVNYNEEEILRFKDVVSDLAIFPEDIIKVKDKIYGEVQSYVPARNLYKTNPFKVNLNNLSNAVKDAYEGISLLSKEGISTFDVSYNTLYKDDDLGSNIYLVDTFEWSYSPLSNSELTKKNISNFSYEVCLFLVDSIFEDFVNSSLKLKRLYTTKDNCLEFIEVLKSEAEHTLGRSITTLMDAKELVNKKRKKGVYERDFRYFR